MATLVLTAVGTALGGPIGGAIGGLLGRSIDGAIFAPKGREGPRLTELALQTSSYGSQIPLLFGTMRVAGTVIWATDLIESRSTSRSGKGQPSVSTYSYSASFAVLLSARPIRDVRRIWAEGKLLRGAAGDFKTATGFRLHPGGEAQAVDPLIASAEGAGLCPAHRGCAYAVFEGMALADYGNRIPSLTFEVVADEGDVSVATIAAAVAGEVATDVALSVGGFAASGTARDVLETLAGPGGAWFGPTGAGLTMRDRVGATAIVVDRGFASGGQDTRRSIAAIDTVPRTITIGHYDPARDYQAGVQRAVRPGAGWRESRVEMPAAIPAGLAKGLAEAMLARAEAGRTRRTVTTGFDALGLAPGEGVTIAGEAGVWRVAEALVEGMTPRLTLVPVEAVPSAVPASSGRVAGAVDVAVGATSLHIFETPWLGDAPSVAPRLTVAAAGTDAGWRQAMLLYSVDDGATWVAAGPTAAAATIGTVETAPAKAPSTLLDMTGAFVVRLAHAGMDLGDADAAALDGGANLALIGDELVQFGRAEPIGGDRWRLTRLLRGRRGTEAAAVQGLGDRFVLLDEDAVRVIDMPLSALGREIRMMASGIGDPAPVEARAVLGGASVVPPSPVGLRAIPSATGEAQVTWVRRSRAGWRWIDGVDAPLGEETEAYRVMIEAGGGTRIVETGVPSVVVTAVERDGPVLVTVRQRGTFGESLPAAITVPEREDI